MSCVPNQAAGADQAAGAAVPPSGAATTTTAVADKQAPASGGPVTAATADTVVGDGGKGGSAGASVEGVGKESGGSKAAEPVVAAASSEVGTCQEFSCSRSFRVSS